VQSSFSRRKIEIFWQRALFSISFAFSPDLNHQVILYNLALEKPKLFEYNTKYVTVVCP
jgi:hypothetical protein